MELLKVDINNAGYSKGEAVIRDIDFSLREGELVGLIGPNGSGKSTTIKAIMGLLPYLQGEIVFGGPQKHYGYIPEQPIFYDELTVWEHLELAASAYALSRREFQERALELLKRFRLHDVKHQLPVGFSKGMQQKVMLIIAFLIDPDVFIVDEPFVGLDPRATKDFLQLLETARRQGAGVLMSTHVLDTAEKICSSFVLMANGKLVTKGNLEEIREQSKLPGASLLDCFSLLLGDD
ncbi:ABC-type transporter ATP-binding protein EcsA [Peptococcaceae bacterium CEB3]|nr:ABC-type transporter ATP-binding protein EcsA [Peptococcaceae bacterium CEB3]